MNFMKAIVAAGLVAASTSAFAADITGEGATFPFPLYSKWADAYEKEGESSITTLTSLLEPVMILVMGLIVGFIVVSILLPIFEMNQLVR